MHRDSAHSRSSSLSAEKACVAHRRDAGVRKSTLDRPHLTERLMAAFLDGRAAE